MLSINPRRFRPMTHPFNPTNQSKRFRPSWLLIFSLMLFLLMAPLPLTLAQSDDVPSQTTATTTLDPTRIPDDVTLPTQPSPIDQAVANLINSIPSMVVFSLLS